MPSFDAIVVGGGHNGLVAATLLARAGQSVLVLERRERFGGAAISSSPWPGVDVRISQFSYLVSLFPRALLRQLGVDVELRRRRVSSYTPWGDTGVLICDDERRTRESLERTIGDDGSFDALREFGELTRAVAQPVFGSLTEPLRSPSDFQSLVSEPAWEALVSQPLSHVLEDRFESDVVRGIVATDALIGTFASLSDPGRLQNRCFLYHVIGNGTGRWDVPVGGMGALSGALERAARQAGADLRPGSAVSSVDSDGHAVRVRTADGAVHHARHLLAGVAPTVLADLIGEPLDGDPPPEGSQLKVNMVLRRLPRLRDDSVTPEEAFAGTFHVNEGYAQMELAYAQAAGGRIPEPAPCEAYCHSLTDPSILGDDLRAAGAHTLTVFGLHMPARLFAENPERTKQQAVEATMASLDSVLAEPLADCLWLAPDGAPCLQAHTPYELEADLGLPGGHIFHRDLAWPFAESDDEVGRWGVETTRPNVWICGAGAKRGGGVSGIAGHNAARAVLDADRRRAR